MIMVWPRITGYSLIGSPSKATKCLICLVNVFSCVLGVALVACGIWLYIFMRPFHGISATTTPLAIILMVNGSLTTLISILGFYIVLSGQYRKICVTFGTLLVVLIMAELLLVGKVYHFKATVGSSTYQALKETLDKYGNDTEIDQMWDQLQSKFECCGVAGLIRNQNSTTDGYQAWKDAKNWQLHLTQNTNATNLSVPDSCCKSVEKGCGKYNSTTKQYKYEINTAGCDIVFLNIIITIIIIVGIISGFLILQLTRILLRYFM